MKVIILAGGLPSTLIEEDEKMPKPMAEIGGRPMLWHIMKQYANYGYNDHVYWIQGRINQGLLYEFLY